jgi:hypothetical protein
MDFTDDLQKIKDFIS